MNNNQNQGFQKGQSAQPPRSPEKLDGAMRDNKPGKSDDKTKSAGADTQEFKPEHKTVAAGSKKNLGIEGSEDSTSACGTGCGSGKVN